VSAADEAYEKHGRPEVLELLSRVTQLRDVRPSGDSAEVPQEDQEHGSMAPERFRE